MEGDPVTGAVMEGAPATGSVMEGDPATARFFETSLFLTMCKSGSPVLLGFLGGE